jgi:hypothetical protein
MRIQIALSVLGFGLSVTALPTAANHPLQTNLVRRQDINFDLVDQSPDPVIAPDNSTNYDQNAALAEIKLEILKDPLLQDSGHAKVRRDIITTTSPGYTSNIQLDKAALNAPLNCNGAVSHGLALHLDISDSVCRTHSWEQNYSLAAPLIPINAPLLAGTFIAYSYAPYH